MKLLAATVAVAGAMGMTCPSSPAALHAGCQQSAVVFGSCADVANEIKGRIAGQQTGAWHDPHNNGTYAFMSGSTDNALKLQRITGDQRYTDHMILTLTQQGANCFLEGCSESQVNSYSDFGTNYCNVRMLYCGSAQGCLPLQGDFKSAAPVVKTQAGATSGDANCLKV